MNLPYHIFLYTVWFFATFYVVLILLIMFSGKNQLYEKRKFSYKKQPFVSVLVPAFNEEGKIHLTIKSLKKINYDNIEFLVINDGSSDGTSREVRDHIGKDPRFRFIDRKENKGKAASLNEGIAKAKGEFIATMDADSMVEPDVFMKTLPYFEDGKVGAVTVSVLVKNPKTFLHKIFELEYILGLSLLLKVFSMFNSVFVTPGPFSVYRKSVLQELKGFDENNITEDMEIAYRIQKKRYRIENCMEAKVYTIIPPTFKKLCVQRKRWYSGAVYTLIKHRGMILNSKYGMFGYFVFFNYLLIVLGLALFLFTSYLGISNFLQDVLYYQYTNFNFLEQIMNLNFDILTFGRASILGMMSLAFTIMVLIIGLLMTRTRFSDKKLGIIGYPFLFFIYQFFWIITAFVVAGGRKIKWR